MDRRLSDALLTLWSALFLAALIESSRAASVITSNRIAQEFLPDVPLFQPEGAPPIDLWEPYLTIDPVSQTLYAWATYNNGVPGCALCSTNPTIMRASGDNGKSWGEVQYLWSDPAANRTWQADAVVAADTNGCLYAVFLDGWNVRFVRSCDRWLSTELVTLLTPGAYFNQADKPWITVCSGPDTNSTHVYVSFNCVQPFAVQSLDGGATWSTPQMMDQDQSLYFYAGGAACLSNGTALFAYSALPRDNSTTVTEVRVYSTGNQGQSWNTVYRDQVTFNQPCPAYAQCGTDFLVGMATLAADADDNVYVLYNGQSLQSVDPTAKETQIWIARYLREQGIWTAPAIVSDPTNYLSPPDSAGSPLDLAPTYRGFPTIAAGIAKDVRVVWFDNRTGNWDVYYRDSQDAGLSFSPSVRLSVLDKLPYQFSTGFSFPYGDYHGLVIDSIGNAHVLWGEGFGWNTGGSVFYARQDMELSLTKKSDKSMQHVILVSSVLAVTALCTGVGCVLCRRRKRAKHTILPDQPPLPHGYLSRVGSKWSVSSSHTSSIYVPPGPAPLSISSPVSAGPAAINFISPSRSLTGGTFAGLPPLRLSSTGSPRIGSADPRESKEPAEDEPSEAGRPWRQQTVRSLVLSDSPTAGPVSVTAGSSPRTPFEVETPEDVRAPFLSRSPPRSNHRS